MAEAVEQREEQDAIDTGDLAVHLLDVGPDEYGDAVLCRFGDVSVLIDGAHPAAREGARRIICFEAAG